MASINPLSSLSSLVATSIPHLERLHRQLDLPSAQLAHDLDRLEACLRRELDAVVGERESEVKVWMARSLEVENECISIGAAVGTTVDLRAWIDQEQILPRRLAMLETYRDDHLLPQYRTRLAEVETLNARLKHLSKILPPSFDLTLPSSSALPAHPRTDRPPSSIPKPSSTSIPISQGSLTSVHPASTAVPTPPASSIPLPLSPALPSAPLPVYENVTDGRVLELKHLIDEGELERIRLLNGLRQLLLNLLFLLPEVDLALPLPFPLPTIPSSSPAPAARLSGTLDMPLRPEQSSQPVSGVLPSPPFLNDGSSSPSPSASLPLPLIPTPAAYPPSTSAMLTPLPSQSTANTSIQTPQERIYYTILDTFGSWVQLLPDDLDLDTSLSSPSFSSLLAPLGGPLGGLPDVEPSPDLLEWVETTTAHLRALKRSREERIQAIYDRLEGLWVRLDVDAGDIEEFMGRNQGSGEDCVAAYQAELDRMLALKVEYMEIFILKLRDEIKALQDELLFGDAEREAFTEFWDYTYTDALLLAHETELQRLQDELEAKRELLQHVLQWRAVCADEAELVEAAKDPTRLTGRGKGAHARAQAETKMRMRVDKLKPKLEAELLRSLPAWESLHGRPFLVDGLNILETIRSAIEAKEAEKELRKRARIGGVSVKAPSTAGSFASSSRNPPPTPMIRSNPSASYVPPSTVKRPLSSASSNHPTSSRLPPTKLSRMTPAATPRSIPSSASSTQLGDRVGSCHLPRPSSSKPSATNYPPPPASSSRNVSGASSIYSTASSSSSSSASSLMTPAAPGPSAVYSRNSTVPLSSRLSSSTSSVGSSYTPNVFSSSSLSSSSSSSSSGPSHPSQHPPPPPPSSSSTMTASIRSSKPPVAPSAAYHLVSRVGLGSLNPYTEYSTSGSTAAATGPIVSTAGGGDGGTREGTLKMRIPSGAGGGGEGGGGKRRESFRPRKSMAPPLPLKMGLGDGWSSP